MSDEKEETATGTDNNDTINMGEGEGQVAYGEEGNDTIKMGDGSSTTEQEAHAGDGDDTIEVGGKDFKAYGEAGDDTFKVDSNDFKSGGSKGADFDGSKALIDGGEGLDGLTISDDMNIDFGGLSDNISNIENIDLGKGAQDITNLSIDDVLDMTDEDNVLRIDGDTSDSISLNTDSDGGGEWTLGDFKTDAETGTTYQEVTGQDGDGHDVTLEISTNVTIDES